MEILSAGTFINLDNQEKIEQLKFTAAELANAAMETEGFVNTEESGRNLALEFWQGLEYMCRESEEATVKNIFLNHFLERLREFRTTQMTPAIELSQNSAQSELVQIETEEKPKDEFLGFIETTANEENSIEELAVEVEENLSQSEETSALKDFSFAETEVKTTENAPTEAVKETASSADETEQKVDSAPENKLEAKSSVGSLSLPEKEPYQFDKCTVTATIQLLPVVDGAIIRKAVLSVKTHDFAPQISLVELPGNNLTAELAPELEKVLAKYQTDLPAKVMDKLKKEKTAAKKSAPKTTSETKTIYQEVKQPQESDKTQTERAKSNQTDAPLVPPPPAQTGQQGNLFGF